MKKIFNQIIEGIKWCISRITYKMIMMLVAVILIIIAFTSFKVNINQQINDNTKQYLSSVLDEGLDQVGLKMNEEVNVLKTMTSFLKYEEDLSSEIINQHLNEQMLLHGFVGINLIDKNGEVINSVGITSANEKKEYIEKCEENGYYISNVTFNEGTNEEYIDLSVPLYHRNEIVGILLCSYNMNEFTEIIDNSYFEKIGTTFVAQEDGTLISRPESVGNNTNLFSLLDSINTYNEKSILKLKNSIQNGESGIITYGTGKHKRYMCYKIVPETSWYSVSIISSSAIEPLAKKVSKLAMVLAMEIISIFVIYISIIIIVEYKRMRMQNKIGNNPLKENNYQ